MYFFISNWISVQPFLRHFLLVLQKALPFDHLDIGYTLAVDGEDIVAASPFAEPPARFRKGLAARKNLRFEREFQPLLTAVFKRGVFDAAGSNSP